MKKRLCIFPYTPDVPVLVDCRDSLCDMQPEALCSFREEDAYAAPYAAAHALRYDSDFSALLPGIDAVLLTDNDRRLRTEKYRSVLHQAQQAGKPVFCTRTLYRQLALGPDDGVQLLQKQPPAEESKPGRTLHDIPVPVVSVLGAGENCDKFPVQLQLQKALRDAGYRVLSVCSNDLGALFDMYTLPDFLLEESVPYESQIRLFNHYLHRLVRLEQPDVVVLGMPGGAATFGPYGDNHFSRIPLVMSSAVKSDACVFCLYYQPAFSQETFVRAVTLCDVKFDAPVAAFCIAGQSIYFNTESWSAQFYNLGDTVAPPAVSSGAYPVFSLSDPTQTHDALHHVVGVLRQWASPF